MNKAAFIRQLTITISDKIQLLQAEIEQLRSDIASDSKSTAGDKHETSRAMAQLEMEKLGHQILDYQKQLQWIKQLQETAHINTGTIGIGSLIQLTNGWYFLGPGIGKVGFQDQSVFCISVHSPLGLQLINKTTGQEVSLPNLNLKITSVC